ncbi:MAG: hypothetical protein CVV39_06000 [Planctomycetes bacterium HGW-Planctomycetes-1]|nr:MAG: hypothetical protein CVV39_06000 [Planctomycetes bacterium HGW-Planctomycetes-1]
MFEALEYYQSLAEKFDSRILTIPGIVVVILGLCIWLAGLRWKRVLGALAGGAIFASMVLCIGCFGRTAVLTLTFIGFAFGAIAEKATLGVFGAAVAGVIVLAAVSTNIQAREYSDIEYLESLEEPSEEELLSGLYYPTFSEYEYDDVEITMAEAIEITRETASYLAAKTIDDVKSSYTAAFASAIAVLIAAGFAAAVMPRLFIAVTASWLGSAIIFAGMIMLLFYRRSEPITCIAEKGRYFAAVFAAMVVFGTVVQLVLSPSAAKTQSETEDEKKGDKK